MFPFARCATPAGRIRLAAARSERETTVLAEPFQKQRARYAASREEALKLLTTAM